ncbi:MAG TPA: alpha/beta fold hydrolase [Blastocatellia bacterium]|jgi:pimeloyl-ACP methyl ester carboxylesterase/DNA-binding CsgD family transcriptional regulator
MMKKATQRIRYVSAGDGVQLAWAEAGTGPVLIKAANWLSHLGDEWESLVWRHWIRFFSEHFRFVRHDERGCGMTDWNVDDLSLDRWVEDLEAVVAAADPREPFALLGISQSAATCLAYAAKHPERVSKLVIYGGYARGAFRRGDPDKERLYRALIDLSRLGWGSDNPAFRQVFTSRFIPGATNEQIGWFNDLCRKTTSPENAARLLEARGTIDVMALLEKVRAPTLVLHSRDDDVVPISEGHILAAGISGAQFIELNSKNHVLLGTEPAWERFCDEVLEFMGLKGSARGEDPAFALLSPREREVLKLITEGFGNAQIAERLSISEKTVRNHVSNLFDKLGVWTRAQAIVFARDRGFNDHGLRR